MKSYKGLQTGPDILLAVIDVIRPAVFAIAVLVGASALAAPMVTEDPSPIGGAIFSEVIQGDDDPGAATNGVADGPDGADPLGVKGAIYRATPTATSACTGGQQGECSMACSAAISNPYCMVVSASCEASSSGAQCTCTYFCAVARGGRQWTPKDLMVTDEGR